MGNFAAGSAASPSITNDGDTNTGIFFPAADTIAFSEGGVEAMRLDSAGNMGLGVTPSAWASNVYRAFELNNGVALASYNAASNVPIMWLGANAFYNGTNSIYKATAAATLYQQNQGTHAWYVAPSGTAGNTITFTQALTLDASSNLITLGDIYLGGTSTGGAKAAIQYNSLGTVVIQADPNNAGASSIISFNVDGSEKARITSGGDLLVGANSLPTGSSSFAGGAIYTGGNIFIANSSGTSTNFFRWDGFTNSLYGLWNNGSTDTGVRLDAGSTSWAASSDERLKDIIEPISNAIDKVCTLRTVIGKYKTDEPDKRRAFLIAQDVQAVLPEAVSEGATPSNPEVNLWLSYQDVIPLLTAAIKEQQAIIQTLTDRITALENK